MGFVPDLLPVAANAAAAKSRRSGAGVSRSVMGAQVGPSVTTPDCTDPLRDVVKEGKQRTAQARADRLTVPATHARLRNPQKAAPGP